MALVGAHPSVAPSEELNLRILKLESRLQRERLSRLEAESIAEKGLSDLYEKQRQLELIQDIATKANESRDVEETLRHALRAICAHTGAPCGNVYRVSDDDDDLLMPTTVSFIQDGARLQEFIENSRLMRFERGQGLPGRVLATRGSIWIVDVAMDPGFRRASVAGQCGLHAAFAFPVLIGVQVAAVMEFFFRDPLEPDAPLLSIMSQIGTQLGRVIERSRLEERLIHDATHDPLTALPNRMLFMDRLARAVSIRRVRPEFRFAVLFIDLDRFKLVNDSLGHAAGDTLLIDITSRLSALLSDVGVSGAVATLARLGGDEFTVLLEEIKHDGVAIDLADSIQEVLKQPIHIEGQDVYTSASIGIASSDADAISAADIMRDADLAMYRAKNTGRARVEVFDASLHAIAIKRLAIESDLRSALRKKEFLLHYQPIVDLNSRHIVGFEALVRWQRNGVVVPPSDFIAIAEDTGLIVFLGNWVMREAFGTLAKWQKSDERNAALTISVNVSPRQFHQPDFLDNVVDAIAVSGVRANTVRLEITESVTIQDAGRTIEILQALRAMGVRVSIDDFGTGYSSLSYIHQLPFDTLKIDRSFVAALQKTTGGSEIIQTILALAQNMKMDVIAEGTETEAHVDVLRDMGCGFAQGFFFSHPLDESAAEALLPQYGVECGSTAGLSIVNPMHAGTPRS
ncbi:putative bifunctional diguanylate cyclase/phosphodiesterase [Mesorhizobium sp.]|uniref:putative bifunctional diguanylate cyclase/phosphodiesterase n=1 Tax=Mesorhizobium sp. TaxID=1871066 RepID=UPI003BAD6795